MRREEGWLFSQVITESHYPNLLSDTYLPNGCLIFLTENLNRGVEIGRGEEVQEKFFQG